MNLDTLTLLDALFDTPEEFVAALEQAGMTPAQALAEATEQT